MNYQTKPNPILCDHCKGETKINDAETVKCLSCGELSSKTFGVQFFNIPGSTKVMRATCISFDS